MKVKITIYPFEVDAEDIDLTIPLSKEAAEKLAEKVYDRILDGVDYEWQRKLPCGCWSNQP